MVLYNNFLTSRMIIIYTRFSMDPVANQRARVVTSHQTTVVRSRITPLVCGLRVTSTPHRGIFMVLC